MIALLTIGNAAVAVALILNHFGRNTASVFLTLCHCLAMMLVPLALKAGADSIGLGLLLMLPWPIFGFYAVAAALYARYFPAAETVPAPSSPTELDEEIEKLRTTERRLDLYAQKHGTGAFVREALDAR